MGKSKQPHLVMLSARYLLALCLAGCASAFMAPSALPLRAPRAAAASSMRMQQIDLLDKVEQIKLLTAVSESGLLSKIEKEGLLSKLEQQGALSKVEKLLPIADEIGAISLAKSAANIPAGTLKTLAVFLALAEVGVIPAVPDNSGGLVAAQVASAVAIGAAVVPLWIASSILEVVQGTDPVKLPKF